MSDYVLFFGVGLNFMPLIRAVAERGFTPVVNAAIAPTLQQGGLTVQTVESFIPPNIRAHVQKEGSRIASGLIKAFGLPVVKEAFASPRGDVLAGCGEQFFHQLMKLVIDEIGAVETLDNLACQIDLRLIIMGCDNGPVERAIVGYASSLGIPTLQLAHGLYPKFKIRLAGEMHTLYSDYIAVYGSRARDNMVETGTSAERIFTTGAPAWDPLYTPEAKLDKREARERLGLDQERPVVLFCSSYVDGSSSLFQAYTRWLYSAFRAVSGVVQDTDRDVQLVVRPHPNELGRVGTPPEAVAWLDRAFTDWMKGQGVHRPLVVRNRKLESLRAADVVISLSNSSLIPEAMILERPVAVLSQPWLEKEFHLYTEKEGVVFVDDYGRLSEELGSLLDDSARREEVVGRQNEVLPELNEGHDGRATERVADLVSELAAKAKEASKSKVSAPESTKVSWVASPDPKAEEQSWGQAEPIFTDLRRQLFNDSDWRYGPRRIHQVAKEAFRGLSSHTSIEGKVYCDLGCGPHHPFGSSAIMFLNGAASTIAVDIEGTDTKRAAEALFDLLVDCWVNPEDWIWSNKQREEFLSRLKMFDLKALQAGNLAQGLANVPLRHYVCDILENNIPESSVDIMSSRAVLEHFLDFGNALSKLFSMMNPGGIAYHVIDMVDHRWYVDPSRYHQWSFLAEDDDWSDGLCNRLRFSEIREHLEEAGFEILNFEGHKASLPEGFSQQLKGRFEGMSEEELSITTVHCAIRKPLPVSSERASALPSTTASPEPMVESLAAVPEGSALKLLLAAHNFLPYGLGGTERYTRDLAREMRRRGHEVRILYPRYVMEDPNQCSIRETQYEDLPVVEVLTGRSAFGTVWNEAIKPAVTQYLREYSPDIVHAQHIMGLSVSFLEVLDELKIPFVFTANDFWFMCQQIHLVSTEGTVCTGPETIDKCVRCLCARMKDAPEEQLPHLFHYMGERYFTQRRFMQSMELVLCPSKFLFEAYQRYEFLGSNAIHAPQGANLFTPLERPERAVPPVVFSYIGTIDYRKGLDLAVEAFNQLETEEAELHIYGNVANQAYFDSVMQSVLPGKTVAHYGEYTAEDLPGILAATDVALVPSRGENYPFVIREILNARVPVIGSDVAGIPEIVKDGQNGLIFKTQDARDLASKMGKFIENPELIETLRAGVEPVKSIPEDVDEFEGHYRRLLAERADRKPAALTQEAEEPEAPMVSIVIPVFNRLDFTEKCLEAIADNTPEGIPYEVVVVDNGSSDGTTEYLKDEQEAGRLRAVFNEENLGFSRGCNLGAQAAAGRYVLFLNNDTEVQPGWLEPLARVLDEDHRVAAVGSKLLFPDGTIQHAGVIIAGVESDALLSPFNAFCAESGEEELANLPHIYQAVTAACMLVRKSAFEAAGGFDEDYWNGFEDVDFCFKLGERDWLVVYEPKSVVIHHEGKSGPERFAKEDENLERLNQLWAGKVQPDVIVEPNGNIIETDAKRAGVYSVPGEASTEEPEGPFASVVVVTYNSASTIRACLDTVLNTPSPSLEVIVVDNASTDETRSILAEFEDRIRTILNDENAGFSRGCNQGMLASSGEYVVLLNPDTAVTPDWLGRLAAHFEPGVGAVGPVSNYAVAAQHVSRYMPGGKEGDFGLVELSEMMYRANAGKPVEAKLLVGFCIMMPRRVLDEVGLIDEALFLGNDDLDISWRLRMAGYKLLIATDTFVYHEGQVSFKSEEESKTSALVQDSTDRLYEKLEAHFGEGNVPHPMELWGIDWFKPSRAKFAPKPREKEQGLTSIIVLTYNELNHTKLCLASIEAHTPEPHELIIVDNGSTDGTVEFLREYIEARPNVRVLANSSNRGFAAGNNQGMALARGDYVLLLNNDTIVTPGWLERMLAVFGRYENVGIVGPMSNYVSGPQLVEEASYGNEAEMAAFAAQWAEENSGQIEPIMRVVGFCLLARREVIDRIGGLDERFGSGNFEDDDFCIRAAQVGYEASVARDVFIHHAGSQTFKGAKIDYRQAMERNWGLFKAKWGIPVETPLEGIYHLPPELPEGAGQYIALPDLESGHRPEQGGLWWREAPEEELEPMVRLGFLRDGPDLAEAMESIQRFNGTLGPHSVWADSASINEQLGRSEYLVLMTPDVIVTKPWLETMLAVADSDESIAAVGPTSNAAPGPQRVKGGYKSLKKELQKFASKRSRQHNKAWEEVPYLGGFCLLLRSQAVRDVGGLDEDVPTSEWLWDLYGRLQAEGFRLACALGAYVHHSELTEDEGSRYDEQALAEESAPEVLGEAQIALEQGDLESAAGLFEEAVRQAPSLASAHWAYGSTLVALDRVNEGIEALRQAAELAPCEAALHNQLGVTLYQVGEPEEAMEAFETALTAAPDDLDVLLNLVELHRDQGRYTEAASHLEQAQRLAPVDAGVLSALGAISLDLGDVETAQKALQHLEALEPEHPEIQPLRQALEA